MYPTYLVHFNKLHSKANGQFISGDGDSDGKVDEHHRYTKGTLSGKSKKDIAAKVKEKYSKTYSYDVKPNRTVESQKDGPVTKQMAGIGLKLSGVGAKWLSGLMFKDLSTTWKYTKKYANLDKTFKDIKIGDLIGTDKLKDKMAEKAANKANELYTKYGG